MLYPSLNLVSNNSICSAEVKLEVEGIEGASPLIGEVKLEVEEAEGFSPLIDKVESLDLPSGI